MQHIWIFCGFMKYVTCCLMGQAAWAAADAPLDSPCPAFSRLITTLDTGFKGRHLLR